jgi:Hexapeptide repeat of succinyl-transferase
VSKYVRIMIKSIVRVKNIYNYIYNYIIFKYFKVNYRKFPKINGRIFLRNKGSIFIGKNVRINSSLRSNPIGGDTKSVICAMYNAELWIGNGVGISNTAIYCSKKIIIEDEVYIGGGCRIYDTDFHSLYLEERLTGTDMGAKKSLVVIRRGAFIGAGSFILKGVEIGEQSVIGAGSVITGKVPAKQIWAGNPARFIRDIV